MHLLVNGFEWVPMIEFLVLCFCPKFTADARKMKWERQKID